MKKVIFTLSCFMVFMLSCQDIPDRDTINLNSFEDMNKINKELIDFTTSNLSSFMSLGKNGEVWFDKNQLALASFDHLDGKLIDGSNLDFQSLAVPFKKVNLMSSDEQSRSLNDDYGTFNMAQVTVADQFITNMLAVDDLSEVGRIVRNFNIQVLNSAFTQEEKDELLLLSSAALNLGNFFMSNGIDIINQQMVSAFVDPTSPTFGGRIQGCSVSSKCSLGFNNGSSSRCIYWSHCWDCCVTYWNCNRGCKWCSCWRCNRVCYSFSCKCCDSALGDLLELIIFGYEKKIDYFFSRLDFDINVVYAIWIF